MSIFLRGDFTLHSGQKSAWKIDCNALSDEDWATLALMLVERLPPFYVVVGVPQGGIPLARALQRHASCVSDQILIVDDVLTTGASMEEMRAGRDALGAVVFARGPCPPWVTPLFRMT